MKKSSIAIVSVVAVAAVSAATVLYTMSAGQQAQEPAQEAEVQRIVVDTVQPSRDSLSVSGEYIGRVEPDQQVAVIPRTAGEVLAVYYEVGDMVEAGDLLFEIDPTDIAIQVAIAEAGYNAAKAQVDQALGSTVDAQVLQAESGYKNAKTAYNTANQLLNKNESNYNKQLQDLRDAREEVEDARDSISKELTNARKLLAQKKKELEAMTPGGIPSLGASKSYTELVAEVAELELTVYQLEQAYNTAESTYRELDSSYKTLQTGRDVNMIQLRSSVDQAATALETAEESMELINERSIPQGKAAAEAQLSQAEAQLAATRRQLDFTKVTAPISGVIEARSVEPNNMVANTGASFVISNKDMMTVSFRVAESALGGLGLGDEVELNKDGTTCRAVITEIPTMIDPNSGLFAVKASVADAPFDLRTGSSLKVRAVTKKAENALLLPVDCLYHENGKPYLYVYRDGKVTKTPVETGIANADSVEILSGIGPSDQVVSTWNSHLRDGVEVALAGETAQTD